MSGDRWHAAHDMWHMTGDMWHMILDFFCLWCQFLSLLVLVNLYARRTCQEIQCLKFSEFSPNRPTGPIWFCSRDVCPCVCCLLMSPSHASFLRGPEQSVSRPWGLFAGVVYRSSFVHIIHDCSCNRELKENIPNWAYYPQMAITNPRLGIIYLIGNWDLWV